MNAQVTFIKSPSGKGFFVNTIENGKVTVQTFVSVRSKLRRAISDACFNVEIKRGVHYVD